MSHRSSERIARESRRSAGNTDALSLETLIRYLDRLEHRADINVTHVRPNSRGQEQPGGFHPTDVTAVE
jgi:hypothetical protein